MTMCRSLAWLGGGILFGSVYPPSKMIDFPSGDQSWGMLPAGGAGRRFPPAAAGMWNPEQQRFLVSTVRVVSRRTASVRAPGEPFLVASGLAPLSSSLV